MTEKERVEALRLRMGQEQIDTYIIPTEDDHQSEYVAEYWKVRQWLSGFTGSAGTLVVTQKEAGLWTDGRYYIQAEAQLQGTDIRLFRDGEPGVPNYMAWIKDHTPAGGTVGFDGHTFSAAAVKSMGRLFQDRQLKLDGSVDLAGELWGDRPALPGGLVKDLPLEYAGETRAEKLRRLRAHMETQGEAYWILASLDAIAWLFNIRGEDVHDTPVVYAYACIGCTSAALFVDSAKMPSELAVALLEDQVVVEPYDSLPEYLSKQPKGCVAYDPKELNQRLREAIPPLWPTREEGNPIVGMKARKNSVEQVHIREAHRKDGAAMIRFIRWVKETVRQEPGRITESTAAQYLDTLRSETEGCLGPSFDTIVGYNANGAIVHYTPEESTCAALYPEGLLLVDSGGQYWEGTTDITRTIALGPLTDAMREAYTLVLKGHIALSRAVFPYGTAGCNLDVLARRPLWERGKDFRHGTGHGVGYFLSVHEKPQRFSQAVGGSVKLEEGMLTSNEPGYYEEGQYGIRIENLVLTKERETTPWGRFLELETVTLCPYDWDAIDEALLEPEERQWLFEYQRRVVEEVGPLLTEEERNWVLRECRWPGEKA